MKKIIFLTLCMSVVSHCFGQELFDPTTDISRMEVDLGNKNKLLICVRMLADLDKHKNIDSVLALFVKDYQVVRANLKESTAARSIKYTFGKDGKALLDLQEFPQAIERTQYKSGGEPVLVKTQMDTLKIVFYKEVKKDKKGNDIKWDDSWQLYFYFIVNNLDDLEKTLAEGVNPKVNLVLDDLKAYFKKTWNYTATGNRFTYQQQPKLTKPISELSAKQLLESKFSDTKLDITPFIINHVGLGVGLIKNQWAMNYQHLVTFITSKNRKAGFSFGINSVFAYQNETTATGTYIKTIQSNQFNTVGYTFYDLKRKANKLNKAWIVGGVYVGYLNKANGDMFKNETWCLSGTIWARDIFKIQPEVYFTKLFNRDDLASVGLRLQVGI